VQRGCRDATGGSSAFIGRSREVTDPSPNVVALAVEVFAFVDVIFKLDPRWHWHLCQNPSVRSGQSGWPLGEGQPAT
jgi:hypothetical protein